MSIGSWSSFHTPYKEAEVQKVVPTDTGVYVLWVSYKNKKWVCSYVGKADNLEDRLLGHLSNDEENECIKENVKYRSGFHWIEITTKSERSGVEKYLYDNMRPECNQNDPGGSPLRVPIPTTN
jgi:excinuclease UvrABC nuclease subunit